MMLKRQSVLNGEEERIFWKGVVADMMSDEEEEKDGAIPIYSPTWRTDKFNELIKTLDTRLTLKPKSKY